MTDRERRRRGGGRGSDRKKEMLDVWARNLSLLKRSYLREGAEQTEMASTQIVNGGSEVQSQSIAGCWCEKQPSTKILLPQRKSRAAVHFQLNAGCFHDKQQQQQKNIH